MKIFLARHGQSEWQVDRNAQGWNSALSATGREQAQLLADWLANHAAVDHDSRIELGAMRVSPLIRAQETAVPLSTALNIPTTTDDSLKESTFYVSKHLPSADSPYQTNVPYEAPEIYGRFKKQAEQALHNLVADAEATGQPVLGVAHGGLISTLLRVATQSDHTSYWIYNTSLNLIEWKRGRWHLVHLNLWDHLPPRLRTY